MSKRSSESLVLTFGTGRIASEFTGSSLSIKSFSQLSGLMNYRGNPPPRAILLRSTAIVDHSAEEVVRKLRLLWPIVDIIVRAPRSSADLVLEVLKAGAKDVVLNDTPKEAAKAVVAIVKEQKFLPRISGEQELAAAPITNFGRLTSQNNKMWDMFGLCRQIAPTDVTILLQGETGTGKELMARALHHHSDRQGRFVAVNCSGIPEALIDSELFGHVKGAFTGAMHDKKGLFSHAAKGTLFLDEIGTMPMGAQNHLLRVLQEGTYRPVGATTEVDASARVIAAASQDLEALVEAGSFREDLYYRLDVFRFVIPPLRARPEDVIYLFHQLSKALAKEYKIKAPEVTNQFLDALVDYDWPGNVRQLSNLTERLILTHSNETLKSTHFRRLVRRRKDVPRKKGDQSAQSATQQAPAINIEKPMSEALAPILAAAERDYLSAILRSNGGKIGVSADQAGISRRTMLRKMNLYGMSKREFMKKPKPR